MQPVRIEKIDLVRILAQRSQAGRIPRRVESGANAFLGVERDQRGGSLGFTVTAVRDQFLLFPCPFVLLQGVIRFYFLTPDQLWQVDTMQGIENEGNDQHHDTDAQDVEQSPQTAPAGLLGIVKDRVRHGG